MEKSKSFILITAIITVLLSAFLLASFFGADSLGSVLFPIIAFFSAGILLFAYTKAQYTVKVSITYVLYALAIIIFGIADIIWTITVSKGAKPDISNPLSYFYLIPNCILLSSLILFAANQYKKWDLIQLIIDIIINGVITGVLFWIIFFHKDTSNLQAIIQYGFPIALKLITDYLICILLFSWFLSIRGGKIPLFMRIITLGLSMYLIVDLNFHYVMCNGLYTGSPVIDFLYLLAMALIAFGALYKTFSNGPTFDVSHVSNTGSKQNYLYLFIYPALAYIFTLFDNVNVRMNWKDVLAFAILIALYWASCKYVQLSLEKEALLKENNAFLEEQVAAQANELTFLANQDPSTNLFNRRYFRTLLDEVIKNKRKNELIALLQIDIDRLKVINDTYGHDVGDKVIAEIAQRMTKWNRYGATIARIGGDEFAVLFTGKYTQTDIEHYCDEIISICNEPIIIGDITLNVTISIGVAMIDEQREDTSGRKLLQNADISMNKSKAQGYNKYQIYDTFMSKDFEKALEIEALLRQADIDKDFELYYQPQYSIPGNELIGAEALLRWKNPEHGFIPPNDFIPIAEQIDLIFKIGEWVLKQAILQAEEWNKKHNMKLKVGVNISPKQFQDENFVETTKTIVVQSNINPDWLDAEITENIMMSKEEYVSDIFMLFHDLGITVSIDDFGSGYSGLGNLINFPFDRIKIDKSLIDNINYKNVSGAGIVRATINMAHDSGIMTIAEGVETQEQLDVLVSLNCDQVQGYLLGRPVPADVFEEMYIKQKKMA